jgi:hypothetical protein
MSSDRKSDKKPMSTCSINLSTVKKKNRGKDKSPTIMERMLEDEKRRLLQK